MYDSENSFPDLDLEGQKKADAHVVDPLKAFEQEEEEEKQAKEKEKRQEQEKEKGKEEPQKKPEEDDPFA